MTHDARTRPTLDDSKKLDQQLSASGDDRVVEGERRASLRTNVHDAGSDANDTPDGLTEAEEAVRRAAEDSVTGKDRPGSTKNVPVFDRGSLPPRI